MFEPPPDMYDALIDWRKRLANEAPFFRTLFEVHGVRSVLDAACGTGRHAALFHSWGLRVAGFDISPAMVEHCRRQYGESDALRWVVRSFVDPADGQFDAVVCIGNSLALVPDLATVRHAIREMVTALRPRGIGIIQVLNLWHLPDGPVVWQKFRRIRLDDGEHLLVKGVHRAGSQGYVELIDLALTADGVAPRHESVPFLGLRVEELSDMARAAGANRIQTWGDYQRTAYDAERSPDLVVVVEK